MRISYSSVIGLLETEYKLLTKKEFLVAYNGLIDKSLKTAESIEDYEFLSVMTGENDKYDNFLIVYKEGLQSLRVPIILEQNQDLTLPEFAKLHLDTSIKKELFYQVIEKDAKRQDLMPPDSLLLQFDLFVEKFKEISEQATHKIGRNDPCPCGSGKKYKNCHGSGKN